jgi:hypothetical protein
MKENTPENEPVYKRVSPPKPRFNPFSDPIDLEFAYSPFWPLMIVFFALIVMFVYEISFLRVRRASLLDQNSKLNVLLERTKKQSEFAQGVHQDLQALAPTHPAAVAILKDFFPDAPASNSPAEVPAK